VRKKLATDEHRETQIREKTDDERKTGMQAVLRLTAALVFELSLLV
jgi:hypothetical protein